MQQSAAVMDDELGFELCYLDEAGPELVTLTRREQAKAAELTAAGHPVTASAIAKRRRRYQEQGLTGMIDHQLATHLGIG